MSQARELALQTAHHHGQVELQAVRSVEGVRGVFLRSYKRFAYDLGNERFAAQRAEWASLGESAVTSP